MQLLSVLLAPHHGWQLMTYTLRLGKLVGLCGLMHQVLREASVSLGDRIQRDIAAIGAGAGLSAAFLAPLSATLFVVEEASSHFSLPLLWRSFTGWELEGACARLRFRHY